MAVVFELCTPIIKGDDAEEKFREIATAYEVGLLSW